MVEIPTLRGPNWLETELALFDYSGSQLIFPLPKDASATKRAHAPRTIDIFDDANFVGNPEKERLIEILWSTWNYIAESSSLIAGRGNIYMHLHAVHKNANLSDQSVMLSSVFKQWILYNEGFTFGEINSDKRAMAEFSERVFEESELCVYPTSEDELTVYLENNTPKCRVRSGDPQMPRLSHTLYIPVSKNHVLSMRLDFGGFPKALMGPKEETDKLLDGYAKEFFSHVRVNYNDELKADVAKLYAN